jgi:argininosuccinate synthase
MKAHELLKALNDLGKKHGIGGLDLVENRYVGMKSRGFYETPGGTILWYGHRAIESITLDRGAMHLKDELMPRYAGLIYNGFWWTPERIMLQAAIDASQGSVSGDVKLKLYKGGVRTVGRSSPYSLYSKKLVGFDEAGGYNQADAEGFIKLNALRLRILAERDKKRGKNE